MRTRVTSREGEGGTYGILLELVPERRPHRGELGKQITVLRCERILLLSRPLQLLLE